MTVITIENVFFFLECSWIFPVFFKGRKRELNTSDLYQPLKNHKSEKLGNALAKAWEKEFERNGKTPSLRRALLKVFGWEIMLLGVILAALEFFFR